MAIVYLARDVKHDRAVALKVLRPEIAAAVGHGRFLREISVMARLNHPHILPLLDSGDANGLLYYVMPAVEGESLRERLSREGQLAVTQAVQLVRDTAAALDYAHRRGVVHRDVKPENIMIHQGVPMLTDFGIALAPSDGARLTETGLLVGTPAYMSPEQVAGEREIDARSDVYSLAVLLFEMLTGVPPFSGGTAQRLMAQHITTTPPSLLAFRPEVPGDVADAIARALAKAPSDRYASAAEFGAALTTKAVHTRPPSRAGVIVLPFVNVSPDPEDEYISDGLTDEIIATLGKIRALRVISRHSAMRLKNTDQDLRTIAHRLNVQYVMEGSVRKHESELTITAHLVDARADAEVWSDKYSGSMSKLFQIQEEVARAIAAALAIEVTPSEQRALRARPIPDARAYECYLRARFEYGRFTRAGAAQALDYLRQGLAVVGENALLAAGLGHAHFVLAHTDPGMMGEHLVEAETHAKNAMALDPELVGVRSLIGLIYWKQQRFAAALREWTTGLSLDPTDADVLCWATYGYATVGLTDRSADYCRQLLEVDPLNHLSRWIASLHHLMRGDLAASIKILEADYQSSGLSNHRALSALLLVYTGRRDDAIAVLHGAIGEGSSDTWESLEVLLLRALRGEPLDVSPDLQKTIDQDDTFSWWLAVCNALLNESDAALKYLARAVELGLYNHRYLAEVDPVLAQLRAHGAFQGILEEAKRRQANLG